MGPVGGGVVQPTSTFFPPAVAGQAADPPAEVPKINFGQPGTTGLSRNSGLHAVVKIFEGGVRSWLKKKGLCEGSLGFHLSNIFTQLDQGWFLTWGFGTCRTWAGPSTRVWSSQLDPSRNLRNPLKVWFFCSFFCLIRFLRNEPAPKFDDGRWHPLCVVLGAPYLAPFQIWHYACKRHPCGCRA